MHHPNYSADIQWSPNSRNELAEIGAEIVLHTSTRPPLDQTQTPIGHTTKATAQCCAWWPSQSYPYVFAIGQPGGRISFENVKDNKDPLSHGKAVIETKHGRPCVALAWNSKAHHQLLSGFKAGRSDVGVSLWDLSRVVPTSSSSPPTDSGSQYADNHSTPSSIYEASQGEACSSLAWLDQNQFVVATQAGGRSIKIYDTRLPQSAQSITSQIRHNLCCDSNGYYIAGSVDRTLCVHDYRMSSSPLIFREEHETILKMSWSKQGSSELGYCLKDSPKFHIISTRDAHCMFTSRIMQCPVQHHQTYLTSFDFNYFDEHRLVMLSGKEYFDYIIPPRSTLLYSPRAGLLWSDGPEVKRPCTGCIHVDNSDESSDIEARVKFTYPIHPPSSSSADQRGGRAVHLPIPDIQMDLSVLPKDVGTTIEQILQWLKQSSRTRCSGTAYSLEGILASFRESHPTSAATRKSWQPTATATKTVYESQERKSVQLLCGWESDSPEQQHPPRILALLASNEFEKAAAIYIFQMNLDRALQVLNEDLQREKKEELGTLILALLGFVRSASSSSSEERAAGGAQQQCAQILEQFKRPYVRAMFDFILTSDSLDAQYDNVLNEEELELNDKVAFACRYLNDIRLVDKLDLLAEESRDRGDLQGILLSGLRERGCELIQKYLERTNDIRTCALLGIYVPTDDLLISQDCSNYVKEWIDGFRSILDQLQMWTERAEFDIFRSHVNASLAVSTRGEQQQRSCLFCQSKLLDVASSTTRGGGHSTVRPTPHTLMVCSRCRQMLPRCSICMMSLTTYIEDASYAFAQPHSPSDKHTLMSAQWFTWCRKCKHGGHAEHVSNWFSLNEYCPIAKCHCQCTLIDGIYG